MSDRLQKYKHNRLVLKMNQKQAALAAGYSYATATRHTKRLENGVEGVQMADVFENLGYSDHKIAEKFIQKAECKKQVVVGDALLETDDHNIQLKALEDIAEIVGIKGKAGKAEQGNTARTSIVIVRPDSSQQRETIEV